MKKQRYYVVETHNGCWPVEKSSKELALIKRGGNFLRISGEKVGQGEDAMVYKEAVKMAAEMNDKYSSFYKD